MLLSRGYLLLYTLLPCAPAWHLLLSQWRVGLRFMRKPHGASQHSWLEEPWTWGPGQILATGLGTLQCTSLEGHPSGQPSPGLQRENPQSGDCSCHTTSFSVGATGKLFGTATHKAMLWQLTMVSSEIRTVLHSQCHGHWGNTHPWHSSGYLTESGQP